MQSFRLGDFEVCPDEGRLTGPTGEHRLEPKVMAVLVELMRAPGEVVTRQQLLDRVWTGLVVTDDALTRCISELRAALGDDRQAPRYLATLPKRGYRLLIAPTEANVPSAPNRDAADDAPPPRAPLVANVRRRAALAAALAALLVVGAFIGWRSLTAPRISPSVAVVPFTTAGDESDTRYFAEGLAEELLNALVRVQGLNVASRSSAFSALEQTQQPLEAGRTLGVDAVLTGTLRRNGTRVRINAELIDTRSGFHLWAQSYDRELDDVFAMQDDIATQVAHSLGIRTGRRVQVARVSDNMQAFDYYLLGRYHWHQRTPESLERSVQFFTRAIDLDPEFARAHAGIADAYQLLASYGDFPNDKAVALARQSIDRALALDPGLAEAHASQGMLAMHQEDYPTAERALRRAVSLDPHYPMAAMWLGLTLQSEGRIVEALEALSKARALDPAHPVIRHNLADALISHGDYAAAEALMRDAWQSPSSDVGNFGLSQAALALVFSLDLGRIEEATRWAKKLLNDPKKELYARIALAQIARQRGDSAAAREWLATAVQRDSAASYELYIATLEQHALDGDADSFNAAVARWRAQADDAQRPTALELGWQGVLESRRSDLREAVQSFEAALNRRDEKALTPIARVWATGHLLWVLDGLDDRDAFESWREAGTAELKAARAKGHGSIPYLLEETYFYAASGAAHDAVADLTQIVALGARLPKTAFDEPRLGPIRNTPELRTFLGSLPSVAVRAADGPVLPWPPSITATASRLGQDPFRDLVPRALPGAGDSVAEVPDGALQGS